MAYGLRLSSDFLARRKTSGRGAYARETGPYGSSNLVRNVRAQTKRAMGKRLPLESVIFRAGVAIFVLLLGIIAYSQKQQVSGWMAQLRCQVSACAHDWRNAPLPLGDDSEDMMDFGKTRFALRIDRK